MLALTLGLAVACFAHASTSAGTASKNQVDSNALRFCTSGKSAPFSFEDGSGFEDRIASAVARAMGRQAAPFRLDKPAIYLVRDALDKNACDVVVGMDSGDERVLTTQPYYRSGYVFITRKDRKLDISSWNDPRIRQMKHIAVGFSTPGEAMLKELGMYDDNISYVFSLVGFKSPRNQYVQVDPARMVSEVASGNADMAVAFAPEVAHYVRTSSVPLTMTLIDDNATRQDGKEKIEQRYSQSMGVRKDDPKPADGDANDDSLQKP